MTSTDGAAGPMHDVEPVQPEPSGRLSRIRRRTARTAAQIGDWVKDNTLIASVIVLLLAFVSVFFWDQMVVTIPVGQQGVIWRRISGTDLGMVYPEGTQIIFPWNKMYIYDLRLQRRDLTVAVLSTDGLKIDVDLSVRFHPQSKTLPRLHQSIGADYAERIIIPEVTTAVREVMGQYRPQQLYTVRTTEMESRIIELAATQVRERYITLDDVLIGKITLPDVVQSAIQSKLKQEQESEEYDYRITKETKEAQRKTIEARGIADFQAIVQSSLSDQYLKWRGIDATLELAKSNNAKVVVIGGRDGMPLILDTSTFTTTPAPPGTAGVRGAPAPAPTTAPAAPAPAAGRGRGQ